MTFEEVFESPAQDYLAYLAYCREKARREEIAIKREAAKYRR